MARGVNKVILVGTCGQDPETRYTPGGTAITNLSLATSEQWTDKQTGQKVEKTEWHRVALFGKVAEIAGEYLRKGSQVYVEGSIRYDKYTGQDGVERYTTDIIADEMQMLGGRSEGGSGGGAERPARAPRESGGGGGYGGGQRSGSGGGGQRPQPASNSPPPMDDFSDDDIPF